MRIALINPPLGSVEQPFLALAALQGHLTRHGLTDVTIYDVSQTIVDRFLTGGYMRETLDGLAERIARLEALPALDLPAAMAYGAAVTARAAAEAALTHIDDAVATLRDPVRFYDYAAYRQAMFAVDQAFEAISGRHFPELIARRNYTGSVLQDLDSDAELQAYLAEPGRCLFAAEYARGIVDAIAASRPGLVGLSATFQDQFLPALVLARMLRARLPDAHIVMGGAFLASRRESIGARPWLFDVVDSMVVGEGETALLALVQALERGTGLDAVPNLLRRVDGRVQPSAQQVVEDLDALGLPDYTGYEVGKYLVPAWDVLYDPTRGCHWNRCTFCTVSLSTRGAARQRKAVRIADDMQALCERYGTNVISFSTDAIPVPLMRSVSEEIIRRGLTVGWSSEFTLDKGLDRPTLELFAAAGCLLLLFGFESASDRVVRAMRKGTLVSRTERIIRDCAEVGIAVLLHVMVGFPGETEADLEQTLAFIDANGRWIDTYEINAFHLDPGAPIYHQPEIGGITGIGRLKRAFNGQTQLPYRVAAGIPIEQAAELVPVARQRIERAIGFVGQPYLYQDGAQLHLYLKAFGRQHVRGLRSERNGPAAGSPRLRQGVSPVRAPFDLGAVIDTLVEAHRQHRTRLLTTAADSAALWQELNAVDIGRRAEFLGAIDGAAHSLHRLEPVSYELLALLRERPETFRDLSRLSPGRRDLVEGLLQALERHGLVDWRGADGHRPG